MDARQSQKGHRQTRRESIFFLNGKGDANLDLSESIESILSGDVKFGHDFYDVFLARYPQVRRYFDGVDLDRQSVLLMMSLLVIEQQASNQYESTSSYLADLGAKHREWRIPKELYPYFREALFDVLAKHHGDDWDESLMSQWAAAIDSATEQMVCGYDDPPQ